MAVDGGTINIAGQQSQTNGQQGQLVNNYAAAGGTINNEKTDVANITNIKGNMVTNNVGESIGGFNDNESIGNNEQNNVQNQNSQQQTSYNNNNGRY